MIALEGTNLGMAFKKLRETKGMSSVELSEAVGISESHLRKIEAGTRQPGIQTYQKMVAVLEADIVIENLTGTVIGGLHSKGAEGISEKHGGTGGIFGTGSGIYGRKHENDGVKKRTGCCGSARNDLFWRWFRAGL